MVLFLAETTVARNPLQEKASSDPEENSAEVVPFTMKLNQQKSHENPRQSVSAFRSGRLSRTDVDGQKGRRASG